MEERSGNLEGGASLAEEVLEGVELKVGVILEVLELGEVLPAVCGGEGGVNEVEGGLSGEEIGAVEDGAEEGDVGKEGAGSVLNLNLTEVELVTSLSEEVEVFALGNSVRVSVVKGEPSRDNVERSDGNVEIANVVSHNVEGQGKVGSRPELGLNPVVHDQRTVNAIISNVFCVHGEAPAEIEISVVGQLEHGINGVIAEDNV
jgi:hypothetical protein